MESQGEWKDEDVEQKVTSFESREEQEKNERDFEHLSR